MLVSIIFIIISSYFPYSAFLQIGEIKITLKKVPLSYIFAFRGNFMTVQKEPQRGSSVLNSCCVLCVLKKLSE